MKKETINALEQSLVQILDKTTSGIEKGVDFLSAEIPDVIYQLLLWHGIKSFIYFIAGIVLIIGIILFNKWQFSCIKKIREEHNKKFEEKTKYNKWDIAENPELLFNILQVLWFIPLAVLMNIEWLQIWIAPKVWLIE